MLIDVNHQKLRSKRTGSDTCAFLGSPLYKGSQGGPAGRGPDQRKRLDFKEAPD